MCLPGHQPCMHKPNADCHEAAPNCVCKQCCCSVRVPAWVVGMLTTEWCVPVLYLQPAVLVQGQAQTVQAASHHCSSACQPSVRHARALLHCLLPMQHWWTRLSSRNPSRSRRQQCQRQQQRQVSMRLVREQSQSRSIWYGALGCGQTISGCMLMFGRVGCTAAAKAGGMSRFHTGRPLAHYGHMLCLGVCISSLFALCLAYACAVWLMLVNILHVTSAQPLRTPASLRFSPVRCAPS
jgi:hypothetical protein